jgi:hypothetical protein
VAAPPVLVSGPPSTRLQDGIHKQKSTPMGLFVMLILLLQGSSTWSRRPCPLRVGRS